MGSKETAYLAGMMAAEKNVPLYEDKKISKRKLMEHCRFVFATKPQQNWIKAVINNDPYVYSEKSMKMLPPRVAQKIKELYKKDKISAKTYYLGHLAGAFSVERMLEGPSLKRWLKAGNIGVITIIRFAIIWIVLLLSLIGIIYFFIHIF